MIVVVGSRHDSVATALAATWSDAAVCSAEDLVHPGWVWPLGRGERRWVVDGAPVKDQEISGVFVRRSSVYADELAGIHPADRAFLASETQSLLTVVLATTRAIVVNPVADGAFGEATLRAERIAAVAAAAGIPLSPLRVSTEVRRRTRRHAHAVELVDGAVVGEPAPAIAAAAQSIARALALRWCVVAFDSRERLITVTSAPPPSETARAALGRLLSKGER